jgi:hypothetical protein
MLQELLSDAANRVSLLRFGVAVTASLAIALLIGAPAGIAAFSTLMWLGSLVSAGAGAIAGERLDAEHLTRFDEAAALMALSLLTGLMIQTDRPTAAYAG